MTPCVSPRESTETTLVSVIADHTIIPPPIKENQSVDFYEKIQPLDLLDAKTHYWNYELETI